MVRTHPVTGRKGLFVNEGFTTRILELAPRESDALLALLFAHAARPEFTVRWRWKEHDLAFWDNRVTQHYAVADYLPQRRVMHRATILGIGLIEPISALQLHPAMAGFFMPLVCVCRSGAGAAYKHWLHLAQRT